MPLDEEGVKWSCVLTREELAVARGHISQWPKSRKARVIFAGLYTKVSESQDDVSQSTPAYVPLMASPALSKVQKPERSESHFHLAPGTIAKALKYPTSA
ncbi:hypothetical protein PENARI_c010G11718 [Penicillium arizonense]|uniref:Uncharacterized protein n=1 Tax=Penicillium arizonense TaxID=1835702 RepID=A0A1F5LH73_PENAI|nr:hypothetical protein PENARI_c010G11718 [Penicillium arizonense]OGE52554.1 hypothetical protein PENARI_c010G11718 [Penicillium arizonense]